MVLVLQLDDSSDAGESAEGGKNDAGRIDPRTHPQGLPPPPPYSTLSTDPYNHFNFDQQWRVIGSSRNELKAGRSASPPPDFADRTPQTEVLSATADSSADGQVPSVASLFTAYPVVISTVSHLDRTDLYSLALTCRAVRTNLLQFRSQALIHSLQCAHEATPRDPTTAAPPRWFPPCARDLVAPCRRCAIAVCRNCTAKPAGGLRPVRRYRRLCKTCQAAPLAAFATLDADELLLHDGNGLSQLRGLCQCTSAGVHICRSCDQGQAGKDMTYTRVWSWRDRYRNLGFGLGTGVGEGNEGVKCGRGAACLAARDLIVDIDGAEALASSGAEVISPVSSSPPGLGRAARLINTAANVPGGNSAEENASSSSIFIGTSVADVGASSSQRNGSYFPALSWLTSGSSAAPLQSPMAQTPGQQQHEEAAGYYRQEIEGIGGVVKKKLKKRVRVGATVVEYEDESQTGAFLERERLGISRSWCAWCDCVVPSIADNEFLQGWRGAVMRP